MNRKAMITGFSSTHRRHQIGTVILFGAYVGPRFWKKNNRCSIGAPAAPGLSDLEMGRGCDSMTRSVGAEMAVCGDGRYVGQGEGPGYGTSGHASYNWYMRRWPTLTTPGIP